VKKNPMPRFKVLKNKAFVGYVSGVSVKQAAGRANGLYGRCEIIHDTETAAVGGIAPIVDCSYTHGRSPYAVGDFEARRAAEIARWKANA
jgi:hypothetical protein